MGACIPIKKRDPSTNARIWCELLIQGRLGLGRINLPEDLGFGWSGFLPRWRL